MTCCSVISAFIAATACGDGSVPSSIARVNDDGARFFKPCRVEQVAGDGLGVGDGRAAERRADARDLAPERAEARVEAREARAVRAPRAPGRRVRAALAIAPAILPSAGTSYQRCGFASRPCTPRTSAIVSTDRFEFGEAFSSFVMNAS